MVYILSLWIKTESVNIHMKATAQYFPVALFIMLSKVVLTFQSVDEILWCDHSYEISLAGLLMGPFSFPPFLNIKFCMS